MVAQLRWCALCAVGAIVSIASANPTSAWGDSGDCRVTVPLGSLGSASRVGMERSSGDAAAQQRGLHAWYTPLERCSTEGSWIAGSDRLQLRYRAGIDAPEWPTRVASRSATARELPPPPEASTLVLSGLLSLGIWHCLYHGAGVRVGLLAEQLHAPLNVSESVVPVRYEAVGSIADAELLERPLFGTEDRHFSVMEFVLVVRPSRAPPSRVPVMVLGAAGAVAGSPGGVGGAAA